MAVTTQVAPAEPPPKAPDFVECWRRLPHKGAFALVLCAWIAFFHWLGNSTFGYTDTPSLFEWLYYCYVRGSEEEHVYIVPFLVGILAWWKREDLLGAVKGSWWPAALLLAAAVLLHIIGYVVQQTRV